MNAANPDVAAARAGRETIAQRKTALVARERFGIETTFSGHSERQLIAAAAAAGYTIAMTYIALNDVERNVWRVPAKDVRRRYDRSFRNLAAVADEFDVLYVFDNSGTDFEHVLTLERGLITMLAESIPAWAERVLASRIARSPGLR